jgi:hypothetical protein
VAVIALSGAIRRAVAGLAVNVAPKVGFSLHDPYAGAIGHQPSSDTATQIALIYELLDAHDDTARIASGLEVDPCWHAHLEYLRALQRKGREVVAHLSREDRI